MGIVTSNIAPVTPDLLPPNPMERRGEPASRWLPAGHATCFATMRYGAGRWIPIHTLAQILLDRGCEVVLTGGPGDTMGRRAIFRVSRSISRIAQWSIPQTLAFYQSCDCVITHDTGPLHLAGLVHAALSDSLARPRPPRLFPAATESSVSGGASACRAGHAMTAGICQMRVERMHDLHHSASGGRIGRDAAGKSRRGMAGCEPMNRPSHLLVTAAAVIFFTSSFDTFLNVNLGPNIRIAQLFVPGAVGSSLAHSSAWHDHGNSAWGPVPSCLVRRATGVRARSGVLAEESGLLHLAAPGYCIVLRHGESLCR